MARKVRIHVPGGFYHVVLRGNDGQSIFFSARDRKYFYSLIEEGVTRFGCRVHAFCLLPNQVHFALQVGVEPLSRVMQNLAFRYTRHINVTRNRIGHLFQGRYKASLVDQDRYGMDLVRYVHLSPVRERLVKDPAAYVFSSHRGYLGREAIAWLTTDWVLRHFGARGSVAAQRFAQYVAQGMGEGHTEHFYSGRTDSRIVGAAGFVSRALRVSQARVRRPAVRSIVAQVCSAHGVTPASLVAPGKARQPAALRALIVWLAQRTGAATLQALARQFERDPSTLSHAVRRLEDRARKSPPLAAFLSDQLSGLMKS